MILLSHILLGVLPDGLHSRECTNNLAAAAEILAEQVYIAGNHV